MPIAPALAPLLARMRGEHREPTDLVVALLASLNENVLAKVTREHLGAAKVTRADLFPLATSPTHVAVNFRSWPDGGITWLAMTGLGVDKIMRRAGHDTVQTTMGYVKLADDLGGQPGEPFGPLPEDLVTGESSGKDKSSTITDTYVCEGRDLNEEEGPRDADSCVFVPVDSERPEHLTPRDDNGPQRVDRHVDHAGDVVEAALAKALADAAASGRFDVVAQLARELEARRLAREPNVRLLHARARRCLWATS